MEGGFSRGGGGRKKGANDDSADSVASFSTRHRQQTLEMLLSRERVLSLLYAKVKSLARFFSRSELLFYTTT